jgi:MFS superfamily sulfate permease-like transporter
MDVFWWVLMLVCTSFIWLPVLLILGTVFVTLVAAVVVGICEAAASALKR